MQFTNGGKTPYMVAQIIQKSHHALLASEIHVCAWKEWRENLTIEQTWIGLKKIVDKYHNIKLTQKLSAGQTVYQSENDVVPTWDIDNL